MIPQEYLVAYLIANLIALGILALAFWRPTIVRQNARAKIGRAHV